MATFKVGQRVKIIGANCASERYVGKEAVIHAYEPGYRGPVTGEVLPWAVILEGRICSFAARHLAPLTPPAEAAWAADKVRSVTKVHVEPVVVKEKA